MEVKFRKEFLKVYDKAPVDIQGKFKERLEIFCDDKNHPYLKVHALHGKWEGYYSFNVTSDYRVIFEYQSQDKILLATIGTHS